jgi:hypothetical protein
MDGWMGWDGMGARFIKTVTKKEDGIGKGGKKGSVFG